MGIECHTLRNGHPRKRIFHAGPRGRSDHIHDLPADMKADSEGGTRAVLRGIQSWEGAWSGRGSLIRITHKRGARKAALPLNLRKALPFRVPGLSSFQAPKNSGHGKPKAFRKSGGKAAATTSRS
jgi:hypothetical protein